jgi:hypothetical protein
MSLRWTAEGWEFQPSSLCSIGGNESSGSNQSTGSGSSASLTLPTNFQNPSFTAMSPLTAQALGSYGTNGAGTSQVNPYIMSNPYQFVGGAATNSVSNPLVAQTTPQENQILGNISNVANSLPSNLSSAFGVLGNEMNPGFAASLATSPQTQSAIASAINPITTQFNTQTVPGLQGQTTQSGQRVGSATGSGSSAFASAFGNAQANELANEGAVAGSIANNAYETGLNITANAPAQEGALASSELNSLNSALSASELPQMTQQYGINQGLSQFNTQMSTIMQALGLGVQGEQPSLGYSSASGSQENSQSSGNSQSAGVSLANPFGSI